MGKVTDWIPSIGDEVRVSESYLELYGEWRDIPLFVTGVRLERWNGINVSVTERWPLESHTDGDTDGFYIGRDHSPDHLSPVARTNNHAELVEALREALDAYLFAEEIDDEQVRQSELAVARQQARKALSLYGGEK